MSEQFPSQPQPGQHPDQPQPGQFPDQPQQAPPPAFEQPAPKKSGKGKLISVLGFIVVALVVGGLKFGLRSFFDKDEAAEAKVGDCIAKLPEVASGESKENVNAKVVDCTSTDATFNVVARIDDQTEEQAAKTTECEKHVKEGEEYYVYSSIESGSTGYVLCLTKKS